MQPIYIDLWFRREKDRGRDGLAFQPRPMNICPSDPIIKLDRQSHLYLNVFTFYLNLHVSMHRKTCQYKTVLYWYFIIPDKYRRKKTSLTHILGIHSLMVVSTQGQDPYFVTYLRNSHARCCLTNLSCNKAVTLCSRALNCNLGLNYFK